jgi:hypothetical protein
MFPNGSISAAAPVNGFFGEFYADGDWYIEDHNTCIRIDGDQSGNVSTTTIEGCVSGTIEQIGELAYA